VVYEWLSGTIPFSGSFTEVCSQHLFATPPALKEKVPTIDPAIEEVVTRALAKDPKQRFESITAFANALSEAANGRLVSLTIEETQRSDLPAASIKETQRSDPSAASIKETQMSGRSPATPIPPPPPVQQMPVSNKGASMDTPPGDAPSIVKAGESLAPKSNRGIDSARAGVFVQQATPATIRRNYTIIDNPLTNGNPNALLMVAQNWNPGDGNGTYNNHPVGVWYNGTYWSIFNQDLAPMTPQACFNVLVLSQSSSAFVQVATPQNSADNYTVIDNPLTNGNPDAIVMVTQNWNPSGSRSGTYNNHPIGVWYTPSGKWSIFNQDRAPINPQVAFNVQILNPSPAAFVHQTTSSNIGDDYTFFNNAVTDGNANAFVLVTQNWNPQGRGGIYNSHEVGVWYTRSGNWAIFNVDYAPLPLQSSFNIEIVQR
jgi:serine/threonine protein kinase